MNIKIIAFLLALVATAAPAQEGIDLSIDEARALATRALVQGDVDLAMQIAEALLTRNPDDRAALLVIAAGAPQQGDPIRGREAGARAWSVSTTDAEKYEAARLTALAATRNEQFTLATFWLRRALNVAPNETERERTLRDARIVRQRNPLIISLSGSLAPSSNVNGGADEQSSTEVGDFTQTLSPDALALEGWRATFNLGLQYRLQQSERTRTTAGLAYQANYVRVTEDIDIPDDAFNTFYYEVSLQHDRVLENGTITLRGARGVFTYRDLDFNAQETTYQDYDIWKLLASRNLPLDDGLSLSLSVSRDQLDYLNDGIGEVNRTTFSSSLTYQRDNRDRVRLGFGISDTDGESNPNYTVDAQFIDLSYNWADPVSSAWFDLDFPVALGVGVGYRWSDYPDYRIGTSDVGRDDETLSTFATIGLPSLEYAGFSPSIRIDASQTESDFDRFDRSNYTVALNLVSSF